MARWRRLVTTSRTRLGWMMAVFFGMQSAQAYGQFGWLPSIYQSAGFTPIQAGNFLAIVAGIGIPFSFIIPNLTMRMKNPAPLVVALAVCGSIGYGGLIWNPTVLPWLWPLLVTLALITYVPQLVLWLPNLVYGAK